jgi:hypothetical protein
VGKLARPFAVDAAEVNGIGDSPSVGAPPGRRGVGFGGHEETRCGVCALQDRKGVDEVLPSLIAVEVASVEADVCLSGEAETGARFIACRGRRSRERPRDWHVPGVSSEELGKRRCDCGDARGT